MRGVVFAPEQLLRYMRTTQFPFNGLDIRTRNRRIVFHRGIEAGFQLRIAQSCIDRPAQTGCLEAVQNIRNTPLGQPNRARNGLAP
jgi:hypothetical protein